MKGRETLFDVSKPGEYGKPHSRKGFICVTFNKQRIFIASKGFVENLKQFYKIDSSCVASMIDKASLSPRGIPEEPLPGRYGFNMFMQRLEKIVGVKKDVIICCHQGMNRSPVAAVIYLINQGASAQQAEDLVTNAFRMQRDKDFVLNSRGHYTEVLQEACALQENIETRNMSFG